MSNKLPLEGDCLDEDTTFISLGFKREAARLCVGREGTWRKPSVGEGSGKILHQRRSHAVRRGNTKVSR